MMPFVVNFVAGGGHYWGVSIRGSRTALTVLLVTDQVDKDKGFLFFLAGLGATLLGSNRPGWHTTTANQWDLERGGEGRGVTHEEREGEGSHMRGEKRDHT